MSINEHKQLTNFPFRVTFRLNNYDCDRNWFKMAELIHSNVDFCVCVFSVLYASARIFTSFYLSFVLRKQKKNWGSTQNWGAMWRWKCILFYVTVTKWTYWHTDKHKYTKHWVWVWDACAACSYKIIFLFRDIQRQVRGRDEYFYVCVCRIQMWSIGEHSITKPPRIQNLI